MNLHGDTSDRSGAGDPPRSARPGEGFDVKLTLRPHEGPKKYDVADPGQLFDGKRTRGLEDAEDAGDGQWGTKRHRAALEKENGNGALNDGTRRRPPDVLGDGDEMEVEKERGEDAVFDGVRDGKASLGQGQKEPQSSPNKSRDTLHPSQKGDSEGKDGEVNDGEPELLGQKHEAEFGDAGGEELLGGEESGATKDMCVQCDWCKKWRRLHGDVDPSELSGQWSCSKNETDPYHSRCSDPEENWEEDNDAGTTIQGKSEESNGEQESGNGSDYEDTENGADNRTATLISGGDAPKKAPSVGAAGASSAALLATYEAAEAAIRWNADGEISDSLDPTDEDSSVNCQNAERAAGVGQQTRRCRGSPARKRPRRGPHSAGRILTPKGAQSKSHSKYRKSPKTANREKRAREAIFAFSRPTELECLSREGFAVASKSSSLRETDPASGTDSARAGRQTTRSASPGEESDDEYEYQPDDGVATSSAVIRSANRMGDGVARPRRSSRLASNEPEKAPEGERFEEGDKVQAHYLYPGGKTWEWLDCVISSVQEDDGEKRTYDVRYDFDNEMDFDLPGERIRAREDQWLPLPDEEASATRGNGNEAGGDGGHWSNWKMTKLFGSTTLGKKDPTGCDVEECERAAVGTWASPDGSEERNVCFKHQEKQHGGFPKNAENRPFTHITKKNRDRISEHCSERDLDDTDFPGIPSSAPRKSRGREGALASTSQAPKCGTNKRGYGGIKMLSQEEIDALPKLDSEVQKWLDESSGADAMGEFLRENDHLLIMQICDKGLQLNLSILGALGDKAIQAALQPNNGDHDPRAHQRVFIYGGPWQNDLALTLPGYRKALNGDGERLVADIKKHLNEAMSERLHNIIAAPSIADANLSGADRYQGLHPDQSVHDHEIFTVRDNHVVGPKFGLKFVSFFVWVDDDKKQHRRKIAEHVVVMDGCVRYTMSHFGAGRSVIGCAVDPVDEVRKGIVFFHEPVPVEDGFPKEWRMLTVHDRKFSTIEEHDACIAKLKNGALPPPFEPSYPLPVELASAQVKDLPSVISGRLDNMAVHTGDQVTCSVCSTQASCFDLDNGGKELLQKLRDNRFANVDKADKAWRRHLRCTTHAGSNSIANLCTGCFLRSKLMDKPRCTSCVEYRCRGVRPPGGGKTTFGCKGRTQDDIDNGVGVCLNEENKKKGDGQHSQCQACDSAYTLLTRRSKGVKEMVVKQAPLEMKHYRDLFTALESEEYTTKYGSGRRANWPAIVDEESGFGSLKGRNAELLGESVRAFKKRNKEVPTAPEKCDACEKGKCKYAGKKVNSLELFNAFELHGGLVGKAAQGNRKKR